MSSSDSEDCYYDNLVKNMRIVREQCLKELKRPRIVTSAGRSDKDANNAGSAVKKNNTVSNAANLSFDDDGLLDEIIAKNSKIVTKRATRGRKKKETTIEPSNTPAETHSRGRGTKKGKGRSRGPKTTEPCIILDSPVESLNGRRKRKSDNTNLIGDVLNISPRKTRAKKNSRNSSFEGAVQNVSAVTVNKRGRGGRGRARGRGNRGGRGSVNRQSNITTRSVNPIYPTYSVGNTDEYPDLCDDVPLFTKQTTVEEDNAIVIDDEETNDLDDNQPLSVKVIWKSLEVFKFNIGKYERITQIFEKFANKENVSNDKLLFIYNDKILSCYDTPASMDYSIAKFIDGGVVSHSVEPVYSNRVIKNGITIKFQCQNSKKPLDITIARDDKVSLAMKQCAERLNMSLEKLKFEFDGDIVTGISTPQTMGLENGDCIDVKILS